jgi:CO/xanthine dehydrogenase Mo-binding subunit
MFDYDKFKNEIQPKLRAEGKYVGVGVACFTEGTGVGPYEGARVTVEATGKVNVVTGYASQGQAHYTTFAQIVADQVGVSPREIRVTTGDTGKFHWGAGTFASRGITVAGSAVNAAALKVREKILDMASKQFNCPPEELELVDGCVRVADIPSQSISLADLAVKANPSRGAAAGTEPGLEATAYYGPPYGATGQGTCIIQVEVDPGTYQVKIDRIVFVHDCGTVVNPLIVDGQVHGGIMMGIGNSFYEKLVFDNTTGQLQNSTFTDYMMVRAGDLPRMELGHVSSPSPLKPLGLKGVGEAGAIPTPPAFVQAVEDALAPLCKLTVHEAPISPNRLFEMISEAGREPVTE